MNSKESLKNSLTDDSSLESKVDILKCISSLSNDEVFTPPHLANEVLDLLPKEIWKDKSVTFLDPCCKTGVFLREITKRLIDGLEDEIPDLQERINHILTKQVFGLAITELTGLVSRRTVYCSKDANGEYSICTNFKEQGNKDVCYKVEDIEPNQRYRAVEHNGQYYYYPQEHEGNILYPRTEHEWKNGTCVKCGASQKVQDRGLELESHAYSFIHTDIKELFGDMKFDVIIGNPPYQLNLGNATGNSSKAKAIYHKFINVAKNLNPKYITMIIPSRWMTKSADGISDNWVDTMINENNIKIMHDFLDAEDCFPNVSIRGGVCYFLWENNYNGKCEYFLHDKTRTSVTNCYLNHSNLGVIVRDAFGVSIINKIKEREGEYTANLKDNFYALVSPKDFFTNKTCLTSSWKGFSCEVHGDYQIKYYLNKQKHKVDNGFVRLEDIPKNQEAIHIHKVYIPASGDPGKMVLGKPFYGEPNSVCSQTYLVVGYTQGLSEEECLNVISYIQTKFFRYLVSLKKKTQNAPRKVYQLVPIQDFSKPWTDEELYKKYNLTGDEINHIESMIKPMKSEDIEEE